MPRQMQAIEKAPAARVLLRRQAMAQLRDDVLPKGRAQVAAEFASPEAGEPAKVEVLARSGVGQGPGPARTGGTLDLAADSAAVAAIHAVPSAAGPG